jgi:adenosylmethionine-8-amino-7-oxononanoate aminotransferase
MTSLSQRDSQVIWHPYSQHKTMAPPIPIVSATGALLIDENKQQYIDAISSWWVNVHGHAHPYIAKKIYEQAAKLEHVIFTGFTHEPAVLLAERLLKILPGDLSRVFYSDNGSTAVEVAIKMAIQYWKQYPRAGKRRRILALRHAYHGDTFGAMSVSQQGIFTLPFKEYLFEVTFIGSPTKSNAEEIRAMVEQQGDEIACFIYEPLLQAAGGMRIYEPGPLEELLRFIKSKQIICIADEVMTGFYRTGKFFASQYMETKPDIICLSKGLTGGSMALGVTATAGFLFDAFLSDDRAKTFFHGHSFTANPIACSAALASLDLFDDQKCVSAIQNIVARNQSFIQSLQSVRMGIAAKNLRQLGTIIAFEMNAGTDGYLNNISPEVTARALQRGIYLRPLGNTVYFMPPYCITGEQLDSVYDFLNSLAING